MSRGTRLIRVVGAAAVFVVVVGVLTLFVFPTRTYLAQRHQLAVASARLHILSTQNQQLSAQADRLHTDAEIERWAREQHHMVRPGEQAFAILPPAAPPVSAPPPAHSTARPHQGLLQRSWHSVTSWL